MKIQIITEKSNPFPNPFLGKEEEEKRKKAILEIFERGNVAVFTMNKQNGGIIVKKARQWTQHGDDLMASDSNGQCKEICWWSHYYELSEEDAEGNSVSSYRIQQEE